MFIVTNDNTDGQLLALRQEIDDLRSEARTMRAEIERLKAQPSNASFAEAKASAEFDRRAYMRDYMRRKRAGKRNASCDAGAGEKVSS